MLLITLQGRKRGRGESSEKFSSNPLKDLSCRGLIRRVFQHLQHVNCSRGQRDFPSPEALIHHIERSHPKDKDSVTFCTRTTLHRATSSHCSVVTVKKNIWQRNILRKIFPKLWEKVLMSNKRCVWEWRNNYGLLQRYGVLWRVWPVWCPTMLKYNKIYQTVPDNYKV